MNEDNIQLNDLDIPNLNEDDSNNQLLDIIDTFEMTTPRPGEDYSTWTLMAASAAAACQGRLELLENEDGLIFQDFLNGRLLTPQHALGLFKVGAGLTNHDETTFLSHEDLQNRSIGARLILSSKCLDLGEVLSQQINSKNYKDLWDLLLSNTFQSQRHAHFSLWILTEVAQREKQGEEIIRLFKNDPTLETEDVSSNGFSKEIFRRGAWRYMFEWLLIYPSAHEILMLLLCLEIKDNENGAAKLIRIDGKWVVDRLFVNNEKNDENKNENKNEHDNEYDNENNENNPNNGNNGNDGLGASRLINLLFNLFEVCPEISANTLGSRLCLDLFDEFGTLLVDKSCQQMILDVNNIQQGIECRGAFDGLQLLITLVRQLDGGCVAEKWHDYDNNNNNNNDNNNDNENKQSENNNEGDSECMACTSPLIKALCHNVNHMKSIQTCLTCTQLPTSSKIQTVDLVTALVRLECSTIDKNMVKHNITHGMLDISLNETSSPILLARSSTMLMSCLLDKHPESGELLSYRRVKSSRTVDTMRSILLEKMPYKTIQKINDYDEKCRSMEGRLTTGKERDIVNRMKAHLTRACNILQVVERQEKKMNRSILSESKMDLHAKQKVNLEKLVSEEKLLLRNSIWNEFQEQLREYNFLIFGRDCGCWVLLDDEDEDDDGSEASPSTSPKSRFGSSRITTSTPAELLIAHDVVDYVLAKSLESLGQAARERKEQENEALQRARPILSRADAKNEAQQKMMRASDRFEGKINDISRNNNQNDDTRAEEEIETEQNQRENEEGEGKTSLVRGMVGKMELPSSFDDDDDEEEDDEEDDENETSSTSNESKISLLKFKMKALANNNLSDEEEDDDDEMIGRRRK